MFLASALLFVASPCLANASTAPVGIEYRGNLATVSVAFGDVPSEAAETETGQNWNQTGSEGQTGFTESALATGATLDVSQATGVPAEDASKARVPEPVALLLFGTGLIGLARMSRKR